MTHVPPESSPDSLAAALSQLAVFGQLSPSTLQGLQSELQRTRVRGGEILFEQGDPGDAMYVVIYGRLRVSLIDEAGQPRLLRELGRGEPVGEMAILTGEPRSATVRAIRDTELVRLSKAGFERLIAANPQAMLEIARVIIHRLQHPTGPSTHQRMTALALLPARAGLPVAQLAERLTDALSAAGHNVRRLDAQAVDQYLDETAAANDTGYIERELPRWLHEQESQHDLLIYVAEPEASAWTGLCLRQADTLLIVGAGSGACDVSSGLAELLAQRKGPAACRTELVLLYDRAGASPTGVADWLAALDVVAHHHVRLDQPDDIAHLGRMLTGQAIGLVLGGGGARGFAH
ncbi:MAG: cyclic nucleotide-binding domain-containing protein, partial [Planctomycetales bacterium]|nr:cyclic nucleotide-binding domain-containing protein [Planctomycetales bacterium]